MKEAPTTQRERMIRLLRDHTMARANELRNVGVAAATISRAVEDGVVIRVGRGLYQLPGGEVDEAITLAEASKHVPKGRICMISALAYHGLTDQMPRKVWMAIGAKDWEPSISYPPLRIVRFRPPYLNYGIETHWISGVPVPIYSIPKTLADVFRNPKLLDRSVAIECLRNAVRERKATPSAIVEAARDCGAWNQIRPYLEAITSDG
jgi:predicted transcriptional regulator of viral defense system